MEDIDPDRKRLAATLINQLLLLFIIYRSFREKRSPDVVEPESKSSKENCVIVESTG